MEFNFFNYNCLVKLLNAYLDHKKSKNAMFSLRSWSKKLGYNYPSYLSQCLRGERTINSELIRRFFSVEEIAEDDTHYISFLFLKHHCKDLEGIPLQKMENVFIKE